ncbi:RNA polymerase III transcription repressor MAF1 [Phytophthora nicotianae]|uniref:RNA polymerase III transcription repressor MAF1 n=1 Tax=Phytophthora nicotianae TaxID=4792 RepID=A0A0W8CTH2_PHYNI|nr:RNA polymerase III transcription repressor MAF1 [Phytophthora nicotianae]
MLSPSKKDADSQFIQVETPKIGNAPQFTLAWSHVTLKVTTASNESKRKEEKVILNDVSGSAHPGQLLVMMGPSGAGKSSLLDCISGRKDVRDGLDGSITVNGQPWTKQLKQQTSYVVQDDLFYETITVREHLVFQAQLRMGKYVSFHDCKKRVDDVMEQLGLIKCRDTLIGGTSLRGISGGERKRLSFATEILTNPSLLFVDEPTSGLDSFMAETVMRQLQEIARDGNRTVIATIHQPSSELFTLFDQLYLLSDGACVYDGPAVEAVEYFSSLGYQCPAFVSPTDYFMRQLVVVDKASDVAGVARVEGLKTAWATRSHTGVLTPLKTNQTTIYEDAKLDGFKNDRLDLIGQLRVVLSRNVLSLFRDKTRFHAEVGQSLVVSILMGLVYLQLKMNQRAIQNFSGAFFYFMANEIFAAVEIQLASLPLEITMVRREYEAGLFHLASWYVARNLSDLPMQILLPFTVFVPAYFLIGIGHGFSVYLYLQIMIILTRSASVGLAYAIGCFFRRADVATIMGMLILLPMLLFGGLMVNSDDTPTYFVWINYISPIKFGFDGMMKVFWDEVSTIPCNEGTENCIALSGQQVLENYSISTRSVLLDGILLLILNVGYRALGFLTLWINVHSRK